MSVSENVTLLSVLFLYYEILMTVIGKTKHLHKLKHKAIKLRVKNQLVKLLCTDVWAGERLSEKRPCCTQHVLVRMHLCTLSSILLMAYPLAPHVS